MENQELTPIDYPYLKILTIKIILKINLLLTQQKLTFTSD